MADHIDRSWIELTSKFKKRLIFEDFKMKPKHIFWGLLFVTVGTLILISNFAIIDLNFARLWRLWPAALILWGISFIVNKEFIKLIFAGVMAIVIALSIYGAGQSVLNIFDKDIDFEFANDEYYSNADTTIYVEPYQQNIKTVDFKIDAGAGSFKILEPSKDLVTVQAIGLKNNYIFNRTESDKLTSIELKMKKTKIKLHKGRYKNKVEIGLSTQPIWNMNFDLGAAAIDFDLSPYKINTLKLDIGAASLDLKVGDKYPETIIDVDAGASSIKIMIPDSSGCEIQSDISISSKHFRGFKKIDSDLYRTENFDIAKNKIYIRIDAGVSSIEVKRYSGDW